MKQEITTPPQEEELQQEGGDGEEQVHKQKKKRPAFLARADDDMEAEAENAPTIDQALDAEITSYKADKGQAMFKKDEGYNDPLEWWRVMLTSILTFGN